MTQTEATELPPIITKHILTVEDEEVLLIGDIAGQYDTLRALLRMAPASAVPISLGDMGDRGPRSKDVFEFFMQKGRRAVYGNHECMMDEFLDFYFNDRNDYLMSPQNWFNNGGLATIRSYGFMGLQELRYSEDLIRAHHFLKTLPYAIRGPGWFASHAPPSHPLLQPRGRTDLLHACWNRGLPDNPSAHPEEYPEEKRFYFGHNSHWGVRHFAGGRDEQMGMCLDSSRSDVLTAIHLPSGKIYQQPYLWEKT